MAKKTLAKGLFAGIVMLAGATANAQVANNKTATLNVVITDQIEVRMNTGTVALNFNTAADYRSGVSTSPTDQFTVTSNKAYSLAVRAAGALAGTGSNTATIAASNINVEVTTTGVGTKTARDLSATNQTLAAGAPAAINQAFSLTYKTPVGGTAFLVPADTYSTTLTFTATQD